MTENYSKDSLLTQIDKNFIDAIDQIAEVHKGLGIKKPIKDSHFGEIIFPVRRSIVSAVRKQERHLPSTALAAFSENFGIDMNYFYKEDVPYNYNPQSFKNTIIKGNAITSNNEGDHNTNTTYNTTKNAVINLGQGESKSTIIDSLEVGNMINNFISEIDSDQVAQFYEILDKLKNESISLRDSFTAIVGKKCGENDEMRNSYREELRGEREEKKLLRLEHKEEIEIIRLEKKELRNDLKEVRAELKEAYNRERELIEKYSKLIASN